MKWRLLILVLLLGKCARAQFDAAFSQPYPRRFVLLDSLTDHYLADSATNIADVEGLRAAARKYHDAKAELIADRVAFTFCSRHYWQNGRYPPPQARAEAMRIIREADEQHFPALEAIIWETLGFYYNNCKMYAEGFNAFFHTSDLYHELSAEEAPHKAAFLFHLAESYYRFGDHKHALRYAEEVLQTPRALPHHPMFVCDIIGMVYEKEGQFDSARYYFGRVYGEAAKLASKGQFRGWQGIALGNTGTCRMMEGADSQAIPLLREAIDSTAAAGIWDNAGEFGTRLARIYLRQQNPDAARALITPARNAVLRSSDNEEDRNQLYQMLADYYRAAGRPLVALSLRDSAAWWQDSARRRLDERLQTRAELAYEEGKYRSDKQVLEADLRTQRIMRNSLLLILALGTVITVLLVRQRQMAVVRKEQALREEAKRAEAALQAAQRELRNFADSIHEKNAIIEALESSSAARMPDEASGQEQVLETLRRAVILTEESWEAFRGTFEIAYPGFIARLRAAYPDCTAAEYRLMILDKLGLSNKEMAAMLGVSGETIRSTRSRLKKKLGAAGGIREIE